MEGPDTEVVIHKYMEMSTRLDEYEKQVYFSWCRDIDKVCQMNLDRPLIKRDPSTELLSVNISQEVKNTSTVCCAHYIIFSI